MAPRIALCAIAKDEASYIKEWLAHHTTLAFDAIHIYDNESSDKTSEIARSFKNATVKTWKTAIADAPQPLAYNHFLETYGSRFDWILYLDIDEFLNLKLDRSIHDFVARYPESDGIALNWRMFGSSGARGYSSAPVTMRFRRASTQDFPPNIHIKTIFRPRAVQRASVHSPEFKPGSVFVNTKNTPLPTDQENIFNRDIDFSIAQINHYFVKSAQEFEKKRRRGRDDMAQTQQGKYREHREFKMYDRNDELDDSILSVKHIV